MPENLNGEWLVASPPVYIRGLEPLAEAVGFLEVFFARRLEKGDSDIVLFAVPVPEAKVFIEPPIGFGRGSGAEFFDQGVRLVAPAFIRHTNSAVITVLIVY